MTALQLRATQSYWNTARNNGILTIGGRNVLTEFHSITDANIETARTRRTNNWALQNSRALFKCLQSSVKGHVQTSIFTQQDNIPSNEDGVTLFKTFTKFTAVTSIQLFVSILHSINVFDLATDKYVIPTINSKLSNLFLLAGGPHYTLHGHEKVQSTINVYSKILQPDSWAWWVSQRKDAFDDDTLNNCNDFMNSAVVKYNKIV